MDSWLCAQLIVTSVHGLRQFRPLRRGLNIAGPRKRKLVGTSSFRVQGALLSPTISVLALEALEILRCYLVIFWQIGAQHSFTRFIINWSGWLTGSWNANHRCLWGIITAAITIPIRKLRTQKLFKKWATDLFSWQSFLLVLQLGNRFRQAERRDT